VRQGAASLRRVRVGPHAALLCEEVDRIIGNTQAHGLLAPGALAHQAHPVHRPTRYKAARLSGVRSAPWLTGKPA